MDPFKKLMQDTIYEEKEGRVLDDTNKVKVNVSKALRKAGVCPIEHLMHIRNPDYLKECADKLKAEANEALLQLKEDIEGVKVVDLYESPEGVSKEEMAFTAGKQEVGRECYEALQDISSLIQLAMNQIPEGSNVHEEYVHIYGEVNTKLAQFEKYKSNSDYNPDAFFQDATSLLSSNRSYLDNKEED